MTPLEHAEIWKKAAQVVAGMDTMRAEMQSHMQFAGQGSGNWVSRSYGPEEAAANRAYSAAATVLYKIAAEYEYAAKLKD